MANYHRLLIAWWMMNELALFAGAGGNRKLWGDEHEITAVEYDQATADVYSSYFPNDTMIVADAHEYLLKNYMNFDFIWASPPCPSHSAIRKLGVDTEQYEAIYPDMALYQEIILLKHFAKDKIKFLVENVIPYYEPLIKPDVVIGRHFYWANFNINSFEVKNDVKIKHVHSTDNVFGFDLKNSKIKNKVKALRNMVDPNMGLHILNCALGHQLPVNFGLFV
jgi:DNA (cytosine-5)-methyltransferase 1